ncbi:hypothetical protein FRC03_003607 [Tulasnella sp. 419]|nr:hypothetical protein FRC03_003607 [Tulasnella sp. 419]
MWLVLSSTSRGQSTRTVDFILSCTNGPLGSYPIFIWSSRPVNTLSRDFIHSRIGLLAEHLKYALPSSRRVYSVFAPTIISQAFSKAWSALTCSIPVEDPYYHATLSTVTLESLRWQDDLNRREVAPHCLRPATMEDLMGVAYLCFEFAATSDPFVLDDAGALDEARHLIKSGQVYVCDVGGRITSIVAVTRTSGNVAAITKVVTHPKYVRQGWAKRLVKYVCRRLLVDEKKSQIALYVAIGNTAAESTYHACGFSGLFGNPPEKDRDAEWLEIGFHDSDLGHW